MKANPNNPNKPTAKKLYHCSVSPIMILSIEAKHPPRCQLPSIIISALPLTFGGRN
jgi:hypothetical protein